MRKIQKKYVYALILFVGVFLLSNPLRYPDSFIKRYVLYQTPIGTSINDVQLIIKHNSWNIVYISQGHGYPTEDNIPQYIGIKSIRVDLGNYQGIPFKANVTVFWGFDEKDELIDIRVWRTWDGW